MRSDAGANHSFNVADGTAATDLLVSASLSDQWPEVNWVPASALVKSGAGTMEINAANSYDGGTTVSGGTLIVGTTGSLGGGNLTVHTSSTCDIRNTSGAVANGASVYLNGTGKLILATGLTEIVARLYLNNDALSPGTYTAASHPALIGGSGSLIVTVGAPAVPSGLAASTASASSIQLTWTDNATDETGYIVERSLTTGSGFTQIASLSAGSVSFTDLGLSSATAYFYRVRAFNVIGSSASSDEASATPPLGDSGIWTSATSGNWSVPGNWQNGTVANGTGKTATIAQPGAVTVTLDKIFTIGGLSFANANHTLTGTSPLNLDVATGSPTIDVASGSTSTLATPLVGSDGLAKSGAGNLVIPISPGYSGITGITGGRLTFSGNVGTPPPAIPATTYTLAGGNENWPTDKRAAVIAAMDAAVGFYNRYASMPKALTANYDTNVGTAQAGYGGWIDFGGSISALTALHEMGHTMGIGTYDSWSANQSGGVWIGANGVAMIRNLDGPAATIGCDAIHFWPYGLNYDDENYPEAFMRHVKVVSAMRQDMGIASASEFHGYEGLFDIASGAELEFTGNSVQLNGVVSGGGTLIHSGSGTLVLAANNTYTGGTTVNGGKLVLFANSGTGCIRGALTVNSGATVEATGDSTGLGWLDQISSVAINGGTITSSGTCHIWNLPNGITMTGGTLQSNNGTSDPAGPQLEWNRTVLSTLASENFATVAGRIRIRGDADYAGLAVNVADGSAATDLLVSAAITEASTGRSLTKSGAGTMRLTGSNSHSGGTTVNSGTVIADASSALGSGNLTIQSGASCEILTTSGAISDTASVFLNGTGKLTLAAGVTETVAQLSVDGTLQPAGSYTNAAPFITGTGSLVVTTGPALGYGVWASLTSGNWSTSSNWGTNTVPEGADVTATFAQNTGVTVTLDANRTLGGLSFANANYTLSGNTLTFATATGSSNLRVDGSEVTATLSSSLAGANQLIKTGSGTLKLTAVNSYSGGTTVNNGTLELFGASGGTGLIRGAVTVNSGATLALTSGDGTGFGWSNTISNLSINGGSVNASGSSHIGFGAYTSVAMSNGGTMAGNWQWNGDSLLGFSSTGDSTNTVSGLLNLRTDAGTNHTFNVADGADSVDLRVDATLTDLSPEVWWLSPANVVKSGAGNLVLSGSNSYDGQTDVQAGMVTAASSIALGTGGWNGATMTWIRDGATLALQGGISLDEHLHLLGTGVGGQGALRSLSGNNAMPLTYGGSGSGPGFCFDGNTTVGVDADMLTVTGFYEYGGSWSLKKVGSGTLKMTQPSTYTGATTVDAGTLLLDSAGTIGTGNLSVNDGASCEIRNPSGAVADGAAIYLAGNATLVLANGVTVSCEALYVDGVKQAPGSYLAGGLGAHLSGEGSLNVLGGNIALTAPIARQVVQRSTSGTGSIVISGSYSESPDRIEARAVVMSGTGNSGTTTSWETIVSSPTGGTFSGTLAGVAAGGWYQIEVRAIVAGSPSNFTAVVQRVGVGDVYLTAGQSNSANHGEPGTNTDDRVSAMNYADGIWTLAADPMPGASGTGGSVWTRLGTLLTSASNVPVGFVCVGVGGTPVGYWEAPSTEGYLRLKAAAQAFPVNGFRAVLWHQGESDSYYSTTPADYQARLSSAIAQLRTDAGWAVPWYVAEASDLSNTTLAQEEPVMAGQRRVIHADPLVFAGPATDDFHLEGKLYDGVHFNNAGMADHAQQWADVLAGSAPIAPKNGNIESNTALADGGIAVVNMADTASLSVIGWHILNASGEAVPDGGNGYFNPDAAFYGASATDSGGSGGVLPNMSGRQVAFMYAGSAGNHFLQTRRTTLQPSMNYALTVALGVRGNGDTYGNARIELLSDGVVLATRDVTLADLNALNSGNATNTFTDVQVTYTSGATVTPGQPISIRIIKINGDVSGNPTYLDFDNVRLTLSPANPPSDYDTWKTSANVTGGPNDDDDQDGYSNFFEYAFGQNPTAPSGNPVVFQSVSSTPQLSYTRRKSSLSGLGYSIWTSTNLSDWAEDTGAVQTTAAIPNSESESVEVQLSPGLLNSSRLFIRIDAQ